MEAAFTLRCVCGVRCGAPAGGLRSFGWREVIRGASRDGGWYARATHVSACAFALTLAALNPIAWPSALNSAVTPSPSHSPIAYRPSRSHYLQVAIERWVAHVHYLRVVHRTRVRRVAARVRCGLRASHAATLRRGFTGFRRSGAVTEVRRREAALRAGVFRSMQV